MRIICFIFLAIFSSKALSSELSCRNLFKIQSKIESSIDIQSLANNLQFINLSAAINIIENQLPVQYQSEWRDLTAQTTKASLLKKKIWKDRIYSSNADLLRDLSQLVRSLFLTRLGEKTFSERIALRFKLSNSPKVIDTLAEYYIILDELGKSFEISGAIDPNFLKNRSASYELLLKTRRFFMGLFVNTDKQIFRDFSQNKKYFNFSTHLTKEEFRNLISKQLSGDYKFQWITNQVSNLQILTLTVLVGFFAVDEGLSKRLLNILENNHFTEMNYDATSESYFEKDLVSLKQGLNDSLQEVLSNNHIHSSKESLTGAERQFLQDLVSNFNKSK